MAENSDIVLFLCAKARQLKAQQFFTHVERDGCSIIYSIQTELIFSNKPEDDACHDSSLSYYRPKRAHTEYTRWHANPETTQEFIVKVLEDDVYTSKIKPVGAINIQSFTKANDKIIVAGALISTNTEYILDPYKDYTRFVPPTEPTTVFNKNVLTPVTVIPPIRPKGIDLKLERHSQHEENGPASPKYLSRSTTVIARQYAPIVPVSFTRRDTVGPLTPRTIDKFILHKTTVRPTRTSYSDTFLYPHRTSNAVNFIPKEYTSILSNQMSILRSTSLPLVDLHRTSITDQGEQVDSTFSKNRKNNVENINLDKKLINNKLEITDNKLFYGDDGTDERCTKHLKDSNERNLDKEEEDSVLSKNIDNLDDSDNVTNSEQAHSNYDDEEDVDNTTLSSSTEPLLDTSTIVTFSNKLKKKKDQFCSVLKLNLLTFSSPQSLNEIVTQLKKWAEESPVTKWLDITNGNLTVMENPIYMMIVDDPSSGQIVSAKQTVMIVAGIQGRDHHAVTAAMYVLYQLIERNEAHSDLLTKYRFWIIPVFNPDGYDYSMTFPHRRGWSKNLRQSWDSCKGRDSCEGCEKFGIRCTIQPCYGINLDRNFEYQWIPPDELRAEHPCGALYAGPRQLSEAETRALTLFLHEQHSPIYTFIAFKEGDVLGILYPYSHTRKKRAFDHVYRQRASRAASAAYSISGRPYVAGQTSEFLPLYAGGIEDWVDGHLGIDNTYTVMMFRPTDAQNSKLVTERVVHEAYAAVDTLLLQSVEPLGPPQLTYARGKSSKLNVPLKILAFISVSMTFGYG